MVCNVSFTSLPGTDDRDRRQHRLGQDDAHQPRAPPVRRDRGHVFVDGVDVRDLQPEVLWDRVGLVPQKPYLFSGTVASNLQYGKPDATEEQLWDALEVAQARDFVAAMPGGLEASISQGGTNVSGGQRQRLAIARAVVRRPEIYLFDDSFSALDLATDARLRAALAPHLANSTVLVVAQRISTILTADQILVLDDGVPVGLGPHGELLDHLSYLRRDRLVADELAGRGVSDTGSKPRPTAVDQRQVDQRRSREGRAKVAPPAGERVGFGQRSHALRGHPDGEVAQLRPVGQAAAAPDGARPPAPRRGLRPCRHRRHPGRLRAEGARPRHRPDRVGPLRWRRHRLRGAAPTLLLAVGSVRRRQRCWSGSRRTSSPASCSARCSGCAPTSRTSSTRCR